MTNILVATIDPTIRTSAPLPDDATFGGAYGPRTAVVATAHHAEVYRAESNEPTEYVDYAEVTQ